MTVFSAIAQAAPKLGINVPTQVFASTVREQVELASIANDAAEAIAYDGHEWSRLKALATLNGTGVAQSFGFPVDYKRMLKKARLWPSSTPTAPLLHVADTDEWLATTAYSNGWLTNAWTIIGDQIYIRPTLPNAAVVQFYYLSKNFAKAADGALKSAFTLDTDEFRLDERLLRLAIIWRWRASKGLPYAEDLQNYEDAMSMAVASDKGSNILVEGGSRWRGDVTTAYPWPLGVVGAS